MTESGGGRGGFLRFMRCITGSPIAPPVRCALAFAHYQLGNFQKANS